MLVPFKLVPAASNTFFHSLLPYFKTILEVLFWNEVQVLCCTPLHML